MAAAAVINPEPALERAEASRAETNRANSQHSTGPRTETGMRRASLNAIKLGIYAQTLILPGEDSEAFTQMLEAYYAEHRPVGVTEQQLVQSLAETQWRLNRCHTREAAIFVEVAGIENPFEAAREEGRIVVQNHAALEALNRMAMRLGRMIQTTLKQLRESQALRRAADEADINKAVDLAIDHEAQGLPFEPADFGFVFSPDYVAQMAHRKKALMAARQRELHRSHQLKVARFGADLAAATLRDNARSS